MATSEDSTGEEKSISNRQMKKLLKKQKWLEYKPIKRAKEREKLRKRKAEAKLTNSSLGPSRKKLKKAKMSTSSCKVNVAIDFSFDHLMSNKDLNKCIQQLGFCYGANRRVESPVQFYVTSFNGAAKKEMEKNEGYLNWDVYFRAEHYSELFKKEQLVYLTSDSDNVITDLLDDKVYIIGGIVDHNSQKNLCLGVAEEHGIEHGRLPIQENIDLKTRRVLAINHVFEILVGVANKTPWKEALLKVIPERKGATHLNSTVAADVSNQLEAEDSPEPELAKQAESSISDRSPNNCSTVLRESFCEPSHHTQNSYSDEPNNLNCNSNDKAQSISETLRS